MAKEEEKVEKTSEEKLIEKMYEVVDSLEASAKSASNISKSGAVSMADNYDTKDKEKIERIHSDYLSFITHKKEGRTYEIAASVLRNTIANHRRSH